MREQKDLRERKNCGSRRSQKQTAAEAAAAAAEGEIQEIHSAGRFPEFREDEWGINSRIPKLGLALIP